MQVVAGKYMVDQQAVRVIGRAPFHDTVRCDGCGTTPPMHAEGSLHRIQLPVV